MIQIGGCKVETALTKDLPAEDFVLLQFQLNSEGLNSENGNLLQEIGKTSSASSTNNPIASSKTHDNLPSILESGYFISCEYFHLLQT